MRKPFDSPGFRPPFGRRLGRERRSALLAEFAATVALTLATVIAVTVLTAGIARADVAGGVIGNETSLFGIALLLGLLLFGIGGPSVLVGGKSKKR